MKFQTIDALIAQIHDDMAAANHWFKHEKHCQITLDRE